ncbi:quinon protein alcohol dehydrogenase-like superfamily [Boletus reticuloceps]|uniref:Quinon protein alcohol dehydrogenase-like superfamily n=1 Tax=Boletus reticuloceps TaxID=495285 RepID=A0A8I2Z279_9AGAM|nr:quinon protein alcohol dehydrogenase-like superfamily [Boletus reticuloceps]
MSRLGSVNDGPWPLQVIPAHDDDTFVRLAYLPDGRRVVTGSEDGTVKVWNLENGGQEGTSMEHERGCMNGLAVTRDGTKIISSDEEGIKVWDVESHKLVREWTCSEGYPEIAISPDDQFVAVGNQTVVKIYSMEGGHVNQSIDVDAFIRSMSFSPNGDKLACGINHDIQVYDVRTGALILGPLKGHNRDIKRVLWSRDGDRLFSASGDKTIRCWNSDMGEQIGHPWASHSEEVYFLSLSPDGSILASASEDKTVRFWDATIGDPIGQHLHHDGSVRVVSFSPSGEFVASVSGGKLHLWQVPWRSSVTLPGIDYKLASLRMRTSPEQAEELRRAYALNDHPTREQRQELADKISMRLQSVTKWFQNQPASTLDISAHPAQRQLSSSGDSPLLSLRSHHLWLMTREHESRQNARKRGKRSGVSTKGANPHEQKVSSGSSVYDDDDAMDLVYEVEQQPDPASPIIHSTLPHSRPASFLAEEPLCETSSLNTNFPPPPDLTRYITKVDDQYVAGGGFGDVYRCCGKGISIRVRNRWRCKRKICQDASSRARNWRRLDHMNIVPFLGVAYGFGMRDAMSLVSLWMPNESLHRFLVKYHDNLDLGHRLRFLLDIANGLQYLHSLAIVHGDLNCNNVLLDADYTARLADFGYASLVGIIPEALTYLRRSTARPGALRWIAPEQVDEDEACKRTTKSDIWSFGCITLQGSWMDTDSTPALILLQVLSGKEPWSEVRGDSAVVLRLARGQKPRRPESRTLDDSHWNFIQDCWSPIEERPAIGVITPTIERFLNRRPQSRPLSDLIKSRPIQVDSFVDMSSSLRQVILESSMISVDVFDKDSQKRYKHLITNITVMLTILSIMTISRSLVL